MATVQEIEQEALNLSPDDRAALAEKLLASLEATSDDEIMELWAQEGERRLQGLRDGTRREIPAEDGFRRALSCISL